MSGFRDIPLTQRKKEREVANLLAQEFGQKIKFRFVSNWDDRSIALTRFEEEEGEFWKSPIKDILIAERGFQKRKKHPNPRENFITSVNHELAHTSDEVRFHPNFNPYSTEFEDGCDVCGEPHEDDGHDLIWHDKYLDFQKRSRKKKFVKDYLRGRRSKK